MQIIQWITSLDIYMHEQGRTAVRTVSFTSSQQLPFRLLFMSGAPLGAFSLWPAEGMEFTLAFLPFISHCFSERFEQEVACKICILPHFSCPLYIAFLEGKVRDNVLKNDCAQRGKSKESSQWFPINKTTE